MTIGNKPKASLDAWMEKMKNTFWLEMKLGDDYITPPYYQLTDSMATAHGSDLFNVLLYVLANLSLDEKDSVLIDEAIEYITEVKEMNQRQLDGARQALAATKE